MPENDDLDRRLATAGERWRAGLPAVAVVRSAKRRRRRVAVSLAVAAVVAAAVVVPVWLLGGKDFVAKPAPATPPTVSATSNRVLAEEELTRVLAAIPVPPGSHRSATAPAPRLSRIGFGPIDPTLTRARWWVVPLGYAELVNWYVAHTPANHGSAAYPDGTLATSATFDWPVGKGTSAYTTPIVIVSYVRLGPHSTGIRTTASLMARFDLPARTRAPGDPTSIEVTRTNYSIHRDAISATVTDQALLRSIAAGYNDLLGATTNNEGFLCGSPTGGMHLYALTFHWPGHTLVVDPGQPLCGDGHGLTLDGTKLPESLEDSDEFDAVLENALQASR
jgi:hypothetical protein